MSEVSKPKKEFKVLDDADYVAALVSFDANKVSKNGKAVMVELKLEVKKPRGDDKDCVGKAVWDNCIISHETSEKAVEFGQRKLDAFLQACGSSLDEIGHDFTRLEEFLNELLVIVVETEEYEVEGKVKKANKIKYYNKR